MFMTSIEFLIPGWSMDRGLTNTVSSIIKVDGLCTYGSVYCKKYSQNTAALRFRLFSQRLWMRTLIVLLSRFGRPDSILARIQP